MTITYIGSVAAIQNAPQALIDAAQRDLKIPNPQRATAMRFGSHYAAQKFPEFVTGWEDKGGNLLVPRAWYYKNDWKIPTSLLTHEESIVWPTPRIEPMEHQVDALTAFINLIDANDKLNRPTDSIIVLPPSGGKTILGLLLGACIGQKMLAVVPTQEIEEGWVSDAAAVYGFKPEEIGRIRGKKLVVGKHLTVGSIQTLMNLEPSSWDQLFGFVVIDESHRVPGEKFVAVLKNSAAHVRLGLTATDYRKDGRMPVVRWHLGPNCFKLDTPINSVPLVFRWVDTLSKPEPDRQGEFEWAKVLDYITADPKRVAGVTELVRHILANETGDVLVTSCRKDHIADLEVAFRSLNVTVAVLTGDNTGPKRKALYDEIRDGKYRVTIATQSLIAEGASNPRWSHVVCTTPFSDKKMAVQLSGRAIRKKTNKDFGYFWYLVDRCPMLNNMGKIVYNALRPTLHHSDRYTILPDNTVTRLAAKGT